MTECVKVASFKNPDTPFTELFSLLQRSTVLSGGLQSLAYHSDELKVIHQHADNAMDLLLNGLQNLGNLMAVAARYQLREYDDLENIGFFISAIGNLAEALNGLRSDADFVLKQRGKL